MNPARGKGVRKRKSLTIKDLRAGGQAPVRKVLITKELAPQRWPRGLVRNLNKTSPRRILWAELTKLSSNFFKFWNYNTIRSVFLLRSLQTIVSSFDCRPYNWVVRFCEYDLELASSFLFLFFLLYVFKFHYIKLKMAVGLFVYQHLFSTRETNVSDLLTSDSPTVFLCHLAVVLPAVATLSPREGLFRHAVPLRREGNSVELLPHHQQ